MSHISLTNHIVGVLKEVKGRLQKSMKETCMPIYLVSARKRNVLYIA